MRWYLLLAGVILLAAPGPAAAVTGRAILAGTYTEPQNSTAETYSEGGFGLTGMAAFAIDPGLKISAATVSFGLVNLLSESVEHRDPVTGLASELNTSQNIYHLMLGAEIGSHSRGFLRPHVGWGVGAMFFNISSEVRIPNDNPDGEDLVQNLDSETEAGFAYSINLGMDLNFGRFVLEGGVQYLKTFGIPQQLTDSAAVTIHPDYVQLFVGVGGNFDTNR